MQVLTTARRPHRCLAACGCLAAYEATYAAGAAAIRPALIAERLAAATGTAPVAGTAPVTGTAPVAGTAPSAAAAASVTASVTAQGGLTSPQGGLTPPEISAAAAALASVGYYEPGLMRLFLEASQATLKEMRLSGGVELSATDDR